MPWLLMTSILDWGSMAVTRVAYEAEGWGVGELWLHGDVVVWHELPTVRKERLVPALKQAQVLVKRLQAYFAGEPETFDDVAVDLEYETPFLERCAHALRSV